VTASPDSRTACPDSRTACPDAGIVGRRTWLPTGDGLRTPMARPGDDLQDGKGATGEHGDRDQRDPARIGAAFLSMIRSGSHLSRGRSRLRTLADNADRARSRLGVDRAAGQA